jgi:hypothetical protein
MLKINHTPSLRYGELYRIIKAIEYMEHTLIIIISAIVLIAIAVIFAYFYMRSLKKHVHDAWLDVIERLNTRLDKIPNLIETLRPVTEGQNELFAALIKLREKVWPLDKPNKERVHAETEVVSYLNKCWEMAGKFESLQRNTNYLALRTEFKEIASEINDLTDKYNKKVRNYNNSRKILIFRPILSLMGFRRIRVLEF